MNELATVKRLNDELKMIGSSYVDSFRTAVLYWYKDAGSHRFVLDNDTPNVPNVFHALENRCVYADNIMDIFISSQADDFIEHYQEDSLNWDDAYQWSGEAISNCMPDIFPTLVHDIRLVLDSHQLFYCFQDDSSYQADYYNPFVKEVW